MITDIWSLNPQPKTRQSAWFTLATVVRKSLRPETALEIAIC